MRGGEIRGPIHPANVACGKCTMRVDVGPDGRGTCATCQSWRCQRCTAFNLANKAKCAECDFLKPAVVAAHASTPPPAPVAPGARPAVIPQQQQHHHRDHHAQMQPMQPPHHQRVIFQGVVVNPVQQPPPFIARAAAESPTLAPPPPPSSSSSSSSPIATVQFGQPQHTQNNINSNNNNAAVSTSQPPPPPSWFVDVERIRETCRAANTFFFDPLSAEENKKLEWASVLAPKKGARGWFSQDSSRVLRPRPPQREWEIIPEHGVSHRDVAQGSLGVCFFLSCCSCIAGLHPELIENLFPIKTINDEGVFVVRLWLCGGYENIIIDGTFPCRRAPAGFSTFLYGHSTSGNCLWPSIIEKAFAKVHGSYASISAGTTAEAFTTLTGLPVQTFHIGSKEWYEDVQKSPDELFALLHSFSTGACVLAASCGGGSRKDEAAKQFQLRANHAYAILSISVCEQSGRRLIHARDPWSRTECAVAEAPPAQFARDKSKSVGPGEFFISFDNFCQAFNLVTACMTQPVAVRLAAPMSAICLPESNYLPANFCDASILFHVSEPTEITAMVSQEEIRINISNLDNCNSDYFDIGCWVCRLPDQYPGRLTSFLTGSPSQHHQQNNNNSAANNNWVPRVEMAAGSRLARLASTQKILDPGIYVCVPFSFQQHTPQVRNKRLVCTILSSKSTITPLPFDGVNLSSVPPQQQFRADPVAALINRTSARWLVDYVARQPRCEAKMAARGAPWTTWQYSLGEARVIIIASLTARDTQVVVDASSNVGVTHPGRMDSAGHCVLVLPSCHTAVVYFSVPCRYGAYTGQSLIIRNGASWQMSEKSQSRPYSAPAHPHNSNNSNGDGAGVSSFFSALLGRFSGNGAGQQQQLKNDDPGVGFETVCEMFRPFRHNMSVIR